MFDDLLSNLAGGGGAQNPASSILEMLNNQPGGIAGLAQAFQQKGLGDIASSWIGTGSNLPVSPDQIQAVLGSAPVQALASKLGISPDAAGSQLAQLLPGIVDKLTPGGQMPQGDLLSTGMSLLGGLFGEK